MKTRTLPTALACALAAMLIAGCASEVPPLMTGAERVQISNVAPVPDDYTRIGEITGINGSGCGNFGVFGVYAGAENNLRDLAFQQGANYVQITATSPSTGGEFCGKMEYSVTGIAYKEAGSAADAEAAFAKVAADFRAAAVKPTLPEEARKYLVQAQLSADEKRYTDAVALYGQALKLAPWFPTGYFNRALVLADSGYYRAHAAAMRDMKRYLTLVPDAPDARAAQNKIYEWELIVSREAAGNRPAAPGASR